MLARIFRHTACKACSGKGGSGVCGQALAHCCVKVLFDQGTPVPLREFLSGHEVSTAYELGWSTLRNGELLAMAEARGFQVFVTTDTNLRYQQNLQERRFRHEYVVFRPSHAPCGIHRAISDY